MIKKAFTGIAALLLIAGVALAQEKTKAAAKTKKDCSAASCKTTAKGKSCCQQPSKTASLRMAAATKTKAKAQ
ncbi:hypothetical protein SAMN05660461_4293 [Chitinophaga ginsengisegetis]|uniref:Periplasmic protein n=1 Tax=Chitinophaga ginsengisegetis TaxID=393003 RepID=A0A1T5P6I4_9BACT|nr:hypothetical protein [Chitinophaga ginsengisegetis]MDR6566120.1 hypothetical protein [Chitinophaga ginsengisegetis]MDR6645850.1 hypothetical protein [Chitinophaga ginsengisegetis]MDR6651558.1 hypothetical protein [Chitinophaga ginsengisegetis]SKD08390.1 hypothetical protein SAMN05660461_4293 [Chitinophaga ginsengisegetis]